jgi:hypothetical protein
MGPLDVYAALALSEPAREPPFDPRAQLRARAPGMRRANRFAELAVLGAARCAAGSVRPLGSETSVYLATGEGNVADTARMMRELIGEKQPPMPLAFINVSSNMAGFWVAHTLGLGAGNAAVSREDFPFEAALELAWLDVERYQVPMALVGGVDECAYPLAEHRQRMGLPPDSALDEVSSWLVVGAASDTRPLARLHWLHWFDGTDALQQFLREAPLPSPLRVAGGTGMRDDELGRVIELTGADGRFEYLQGRGQAQTHTAYGIAHFIASQKGGLLHLNQGNDGRYCVVCLETR